MHKLIFVLGLIDICARKTLALPQSGASFDEMQKDRRPIGESLSEEELVQEGLILINSENYEEAVRYLDKAIEESPDTAAYLRLRCDCYSKLGKLDQAKQDCERAEELEKADKEGWTRLITELFNSEKYNEALEKAIASNNVELLERLGLRFHYIRDYEKAVECYTEAIKRDPNVAENYLKRGLCFQDMNEIGKAMADYRNAIEMPSETGDAEQMGRHHLREMLLRANEYEKLVDEIILFKDPKIIAPLAKILETRGKFDEAVRCYTAAINKDPGHILYYEKRGFCYKRAGNLPAAIRDFKTAVDKEPQNKHFWLSLTTALIQHEEFHEAEEALKNFEKRVSNYSDLSQVQELRRQIPKDTETRQKNL